jgi:Flp pilus assembly protein TadG
MLALENRMFAPHRRTNRLGRRGAVAVEFAMTVSILFTLLFAADGERRSL